MLNQRQAPASSVMSLNGQMAFRAHNGRFLQTLFLLFPLGSVFAMLAWHLCSKCWLLLKPYSSLLSKANPGAIVFKTNYAHPADKVDKRNIAPVTIRSFEVFLVFKAPASGIVKCRLQFETYSLALRPKPNNITGKSLTLLSHRRSISGKLQWKTAGIAAHDMQLDERI